MNKWEKFGGMAFATMAALIAIWMVGAHFGLDKDSLPVSVKAIGSIGAIIGAVEIGRRQVAAIRKETIESEMRSALPDAALLELLWNTIVTRLNR